MVLFVCSDWLVKQVNGPVHSEIQDGGSKMAGWHFRSSHVITNKNTSSYRESRGLSTRCKIIKTKKPRSINPLLPQLAYVFACMSVGKLRILLILIALRGSHPILQWNPPINPAQSNIMNCFSYKINKIDIPGILGRPPFYLRDHFVRCFHFHR